MSLCQVRPFPLALGDLGTTKLAQMFLNFSSLRHRKESVFNKQSLWWLQTADHMTCASVGVPADFDFRRPFSLNRQFFRRNRRISKFVLHCNPTSELNTTITTTERRK